MTSPTALLLDAHRWELAALQHDARGEVQLAAQVREHAAGLRHQASAIVREPGPTWPAAPVPT
jgi:hypothetical protein